MNTKSLCCLAALTLLLTIPAHAQNEDWARTTTYAKSNSEITSSPKAVLLGDSITEGWAKADPDFFTQNNFIGRGISGQTTSQILVRMRTDVVELHPKYVVILAGINDIAHNAGHAVDVQTAVGSVKSMCDIAKANGIRPIVCSLLCSYYIPWRTDVPDCYEKVLEFNSLLKEYAKKNRIPYVDYFTLMADENGHIRPEYSRDNVHPVLEGFKVMEEYLLRFIR